MLDGQLRRCVDESVPTAIHLGQQSRSIQESESFTWTSSTSRGVSRSCDTFAGIQMGACLRKYPTGCALLDLHGLSSPDVFLRLLYSQVC